MTYTDEQGRVGREERAIRTEEGEEYVTSD